MMPILSKKLNKELKKNFTVRFWEILVGVWYVKFIEFSFDRYQIKSDSNERQQVIITPRELDQEALPKNSRTWLNRHFVFTHGYGFTVSPVNTKAPDGLPEYFIRNLGSSTKIEGNKIQEINKILNQKEEMLRHLFVKKNEHEELPTKILKSEQLEGNNK